MQSKLLVISPGPSPRKRGRPRPPVTPTFRPFPPENKAPPSSHPISPFYNRTGMKLSSSQPPPRSTHKIPNEPIFPPNPYQIQPLTPSRHEPIPNPPAPATFLYNKSCQ